MQCGAQPDEASNTLTRRPATHNRLLIQAHGFNADADMGAALARTYHINWKMAAPLSAFDPSPRSGVLGGGNGGSNAELAEKGQRQGQALDLNPQRE